MKTPKTVGISNRVHGLLRAIAARRRWSVKVAAEVAIEELAKVNGIDESALEPVAAGVNGQPGETGNGAE